MQCTGLDMIIYVLSLHYAKNPNNVEFSCKDFRSSLLAENVTPSYFSSLLSPLGGASMKKKKVKSEEEIEKRKKKKEEE